MGIYVVENSLFLRVSVHSSPSPDVGSRRMVSYCDGYPLLLTLFCDRGRSLSGVRTDVVSEQVYLMADASKVMGDALVRYFVDEKMRM